MRAGQFVAHLADVPMPQADAGLQHPGGKAEMGPTSAARRKRAGSSIAVQKEIAQIGAATGMTEGSVRVNLHRGMAMLRERLGAREADR